MLGTSLAILILTPQVEQVLLHVLVTLSEGRIVWIPLYYTCQVSRLRRESHACGLKTSISRRLTPASRFLTPDWKMSCCRLAWHNLEKYVNSDPCEEGKPCVKWINDNTFGFLTISDWSEKHWEWARVYTRLRLGLGNVRRAVSAFVTVCKFGTKTRENVCASPVMLSTNVGPCG